MIFTYKALHPNGSSTSGTIEAVDHTAAIAALTHQGLHPLTVKAGNGKGMNGNITIPGFGQKIKTQDMVIFVRQLSTMISAGVPLARGLTVLQESPSSPYFREVLGKVSKDVENGTSLGE